MAAAAAYVGSGAVVAADVCVLLAEAPVEFQLTKISQELNSSALHGILAEVHHAVKVVVVGRLGVSVSFSVHCAQAKTTLTGLGKLFDAFAERFRVCLLLIILLMRCTSVYE